MMKKIFLFLILFPLVCSCAFQTKHRGYMFPEDIQDKVEAIKTTAQLENELGSPQLKTVIGDNVWVYYGATESYRGPLPVTYEDKKALLVWSDRAGRVKKCKILKDEDFPEIEVADGETAIPAAIELNAIEELFNNVGRFSAAGLGQ